MPYIPHTPEELRQMLEFIGVNSIDSLFEDIAPLRTDKLNLPDGLGEMEVLAKLETLAARNRTDIISFLGGGFYEHYIPAAVDYIAGRGEFFSAYTPYQAECSQGTLQAIFEYQTAVCRLLEMDYANASVYDGGSAIIEGIRMAVRHTKRSAIIIDEAINPVWRLMVDTAVSNLGINLRIIPHKNGKSDIQALKAEVNEKIAAVIVQNPNFFGTVDDFTEFFSHAHKQGSLSLIAVNPLMQAILKTPGEMGADIAVAEGQVLGLPLSFGGPYLGIMACNKKLLRQLPGRIVGRTTDAEGKTGYTLTLQAREQHIRRNKATSNICSNQALCALRSLTYMSLLSSAGLISTAELCLERARYAASRLTALPGISLMNDGQFAYEFTIILPLNAKNVVNAMLNKGIAPGLPLSCYYSDMDNALLVACTECHSKEQIDLFTKTLEEIL